jgi:1-acyl-sn-glycerol-3-phosphate acyltransferase
MMTFHLVDTVNSLFCRVMFRVRSAVPSPVPLDGAVLLVANHSSYADPLILSATAGRPITYVIAHEVYRNPWLRWMFKMFRYIPVKRHCHDIAAVREMLRALDRGEVLGMFPEGGIDEHYRAEGHRGVGYLALKTGAPIVPVGITWEKARPVSLCKTLLTPGQALVRYGTPFRLGSRSAGDREVMADATAKIMGAIRALAGDGDRALHDNFG